MNSSDAPLGSRVYLDTNLYIELMQRTPRITLVPVDRRVILCAVDLRANVGLRSMDALHAATALVHGCETFLTNDERL